MSHPDIEQMKLTLARAQGAMDAYARGPRIGPDGGHTPVWAQIEELQELVGALYVTLRDLVDYVGDMPPSTG